jgi:hypothetical protein
MFFKNISTTTIITAFDRPLFAEEISLSVLFFLYEQSWPGCPGVVPASLDMTGKLYVKGSEDFLE